jgi:5'-nucleotidase
VLRILIDEPSLSLVNVNFPDRPTGIRWTRQSVRHYDGYVVPAEDPMGRPIYWFTVRPVEATEEGSDRWAVENGLVSVTPLRLDLTSESDLERVRASRPF